MIERSILVVIFCLIGSLLSAAQEVPEIASEFSVVMTIEASETDAPQTKPRPVDAGMGAMGKPVGPKAAPRPMGQLMNLNEIVQTATPIRTTVVKSGDRIRLETNGDFKSVLIMYPGEQKTVALLAQQKQAVQMPYIPAQNTDPFKDLLGAWKLLGKDKIEGVTQRKYQLTSGASVRFVWIDPEHNTVTRIASADGKGQTITFSNYDLRKHDDLFRIPEDYQKLGGAPMPASPAAMRRPESATQR